MSFFASVRFSNFGFCDHQSESSAKTFFFSQKMITTKIYFAEQVQIFYYINYFELIIINLIERGTEPMKKLFEKALY